LRIAQTVDAAIGRNPEADQLTLDASVPVGAEISVTVRDLHVLVHGSAEPTCPAVERPLGSALRLFGSAER
jgi:hypothetical protein